MNQNEVINVTVPTQFELSNPYPNPFNNVTKINFSIPNESIVSLKVYDLLGKEIANLMHQNFEPGFYDIKWHAEDISSGIYFVKLDAGEFVQTLKIMLFK